MNSVYERMKARGVNMSWYEKARGKHKDPEATPLVDDACYDLSVYLLRKDGSLWTTKGAEPYHKVRDGKVPRENEIYVCLHCKAQSLRLPVKHKGVNHETAV